MAKQNDLRNLLQQASGNTLHSEQCRVKGQVIATCHNGGSCKSLTDQSDIQSPCSCRDGFGGRFCEEPCTLQCRNGAQCVFQSENDESSWGNTETTGGMFCTCPVGFVGLRCEQKAIFCGSNGDHICLFGSSCGSNRNTGDYQCKYAQHQRPRLTRCLPTAQSIEFYEGMAVAAFCLNGGSCREVSIDGKM